MLILALAHARGTGDGTILGRYYTLFQRYVSFIANNTFDPNQQTSDSLDPILQQNVANITNLGVKGIVGLRAMVQIAEAVGDKAGAAQYACLATKMTADWTDWTLFTAGASTSLGWVYRDGSSQGLMYNLYADKLLGLGAFDDSIYQAEANGYSTSNTYGVALSSNSNFMTRSDWTLFVAAALSDAFPTTRDGLVAGVHARASNNATNGTFSNLYNVQTGAGIEQGISPNGFATPAQGAMMALLALSTPNKPISVPSSLMHSSFSSPTPRGEQRANEGAIAGGVIAGVVVLCVALVFAVLFCKRRGRSKRADTMPLPLPVHSQPLARSLPPIPGLQDAAPGRSDDSDYYATRTSSSLLTTLATVGIGRSQSSSRTGSRNTGTSLPQYSTVLRQEIVGQGDGGLSGQTHPLEKPRNTRVARMNGTAELRGELAMLRREMAEFRAQTDPPPLYASGI
uniref:Glutaminase A central domain-containing protein n=1 Tax=Mycena chlorophos TaxID=658473 RepID=A0ABQ0LR40_MYCCL|nr:predicted protein [Mycena chlorophos]